MSLRISFILILAAAVATPQDQNLDLDDREVLKDIISYFHKPKPTTTTEVIVTFPDIEFISKLEEYVGKEENVTVDVKNNSVSEMVRDGEETIPVMGVESVENLMEDLMKYHPENETAKAEIFMDKFQKFVSENESGQNGSEPLEGSLHESENSPIDEVMNQLQGYLRDNERMTDKNFDSDDIDKLGKYMSGNEVSLGEQRSLAMDMVKKEEGETNQLIIQLRDLTETTILETTTEVKNLSESLTSLVTEIDVDSDTLVGADSDETIESIVSGEEAKAVPVLNPIPPENHDMIKSEETQIKNYPYLVSIQEMGEMDTDNKHLCSGTIISTKHVLTSAQGVTYPRSERVRDFSKFVIIVGANDIAETTTKDSQMKAISEIYTHPDFKRISLANDIALVAITVPFQFNDFTQPVKLIKWKAFKTRPPSETYSSCRAAGWGATNTEVPELRHIRFKISQNKDCELLLLKQMQYLFSPDLQLCTSNPNLKFCWGDSGSPLICSGRQVAFVSWGPGCGVATNPGVWTRIDPYVKWIKNMTEPKVLANVVVQKMTGEMRRRVVATDSAMSVASKCANSLPLLCILNALKN